MKNLSKIIGILLFLVLAVDIQAESIDECKSDLYFANGIMMKYSEKNASKMWSDEVDDLLASKPELYKKIANIKMSYNKSQGFLDDLLESFEQVMSNEWGWFEFTTFFEQFLTSHNIQEDWVPHLKDLVKQTNSYKESIKLGHNVIVIAHSQGNYFTNEAYELLDEWMKPYFHMMGVATPANHVAGGGPYVTFHNDMIMSVVTGLPSNRENPNTEHNSVFSIEAHDFYTSYMTAENTRKEIQDFIVDQVKEHENAPSQWETDQEFGLNTCDYKITVKHRYDPSIEMGEKVYPFNAAKKLYQVNGEWVKASCGGENIYDQWEGQKENECWLIDNPLEEKISRQLSIFLSCSRKVNLSYESAVIEDYRYQSNIFNECRGIDSIIEKNSFGGTRKDAYEMIDSILPLYKSIEDKQLLYFESEVSKIKEVFGEDFIIKKSYQKFSYSGTSVNYNWNPFCRVLYDSEYSTDVDCSTIELWEIKFN